MRPSEMQTLSIQPAGAATPSTVYKASHCALRILVRNIGPVLVFFAYDADVLTCTAPAAPGASSFRLPSAREDVFVLAPRQSLYAITAGVGGTISIAASELCTPDQGE